MGNTSGAFCRATKTKGDTPVIWVTPRKKNKEQSPQSLLKEYLPYPTRAKS